MFVRFQRQCLKERTEEIGEKETETPTGQTDTMEGQLGTCREARSNNDTLFVCVREGGGEHKDPLKRESKATALLYANQACRKQSYLVDKFPQDYTHTHTHKEAQGRGSDLEQRTQGPSLPK